MAPLTSPRTLLPVAWIALSVSAAYALWTAITALALGPGHLWVAFSYGSYLGQRPLPAIGHMVPLGLLALLLGGVAIAAPSGEGLARTPWTRLAATLLPLVLSPWVLAQDDASRRPALLALTLGASVATAVWLRNKGRDEGAGEGLRGHAPVLVAMGVHAVWLSYLAITRDRALWSATVDLGIFKEALWHTLHGRPMFSPTVGYSFLGEHFSPVLFLLAPLYALWPTSALLLIVQTVAISASAWPVYRLARANGVGRDLATALAAAMIFTPQMQTALLYDFHMDLLAVPAMCWLALSLHTRRWTAAAISLALLVSVKEDMFIPGVAVLLAHALPGDRTDRRRAALLGVISVAYCAFAMAVLLKRFGPPPGVPVYMSDGSEPAGYKFLRNFRHLAGRPGPLLTLLGQPIRFGLYALSDARLTTLLSFVAPLALLPFAAGLRVALLMPLGIVLLSDNPEIVALRYHYAAVQHPGVYLAAVYGAARLLDRAADRARLSRALLSFTLSAAAVMAALHPSSMASRTHPTDTRAVTEHVRAVDRLLARIPADAPVTVSTWLGPRVSNRPWGVIFPYGLDRATWAAVDLQRPPWPQTFEQRDETIRAMLRGAWTAVAWERGALVMQKGGDRARNAEALRDLFARRRYEVEGTEQTDFPNCSVRDARASDGRARVVRADDPRAAGFVVFGPHLRLPGGRWRVTFRLRAEPNGVDGEIGNVDVFRNGQVLAAMDLSPSQFPDPGWHDVALEFLLTDPWSDAIELRVHTSKRHTLGADVITLEALDEPAAVSAWMGN